MGTYLTVTQIKRAQDELRIVYAMPYSSSLVGPAWEQILAMLKGGSQTQDPMSAGERWKRDNRARPDIVVIERNAATNYSLKTEAIQNDETTTTCKRFSWLFRRHHCRSAKSR